MDNAILQQEMHNIMRTGYRLTPATMRYRLSQGAWIPARHLMYLSVRVAQAVAEGGKFVVVEMPARHGKSEFISVSTPVWFLDHWPHKNVILTSYGAELSTEFSYKIRDMFNDPDMQPLLRTKIRQDRKRVDRFMTTEGGGVMAAGVGGPITGRGADLLIVDDYIKNAEEALSQAKKEAIWNWFISTAYTRLEPGGTVIILATRWDRNDLIGRVIEHFGERVEVIRLPALAKEDDPLGREVGEALWPERYSREELLQIKAALGTYWWNAMYQQDPPASMNSVDLAGCLNIIKEEELPHRSLLRTIRAWDLAATQGAGDYTAGPKMSLLKGDDGRVKIFIHDIKHKRLSSAGVEKLVKYTAEGEPEVPIWIEQEPGSSGKTLIEHYLHDVLPHHDVKGEKPSGKIEVRASPFLAAVENGDVYVVEGDYVQAFKDELDGFPDGDHDDIISACALAYNKLYRGQFGGVVWGRTAGKGSRATHISTRRNTKGVSKGVTWR